MSEDNVQNENEMKGEICKEGNFLPKSEVSRSMRIFKKLINDAGKC